MTPGPLTNIGTPEKVQSLTQKCIKNVFKNIRLKNNNPRICDITMPAF